MKKYMLQILGHVGHLQLFITNIQMVGKLIEHILEVDLNIVMNIFLNIQVLVNIPLILVLQLNLVYLKDV